MLSLCLRLEIRRGAVFQSQRHLIPWTVVLFAGLIFVPATREAFAGVGSSLMYQISEVLIAVGLYF